MAEFAGLAIGVISLAGLFNNAVDCFEFVQLGRAFGKIFQTSQLKLDNARLRLSRWGASLELNNDTQETRSLHEVFGSHQDIKQAEALLGQILELFADAEGVSKRFKSRTNVGDGSLATYDPQTDLEPPLAVLHEKMRQLSIERQNQANVRQKAKWALYEEKNFRRLIEDVTERVNALVELFPASEAHQQQLCKSEVSILGASEGVSVLREIAVEQDKLLEAAFATATGSLPGSHSTVFSGSNHAGFQIGHNSGSISGLTFGSPKG